MSRILNLPLHECDWLISEQTRKRAFLLVAQAYSSITGDDFAAFVGMPVSEAVEGAHVVLSDNGAC